MVTCLKWWSSPSGLIHEDQEFLPDQLDGDRTITQAPTPRAPLAWQAVTSGEKINSGHDACIIQLYLFTVILTTGSPLKLPPSVLEWRLSRAPTPGTIWA